MKKTVVALSLLAIPAFLATEAAANPLYVRADVGTTMETEVDGVALTDGQVFGAGLGAKLDVLGLPLRIEGGVNRLNADLELGFLSVEGSANDYYASAYLDVPMGERLTAFAGGGVDYIQASVDTPFFQDDAEGSGWHVAAGMAYEVNDRVTIEGQVRRMSTDSLNFSFGDVDLQTHTATMGVRFAL